MITEKSAGAIIFKRESEENRYLLLYKKKSQQYREAWDFPKGNIEANETAEKTAKREVREEAGIDDIFFVPNFREEIRFFYRRENKTIHKTIIFFLCETRQEEITLSCEHDNYKWCRYEEASSLLTHKNSKDILKKADDFLHEQKKQKRLI